MSSTKDNLLEKDSTGIYITITLELSKEADLGLFYKAMKKETPIFDAKITSIQANFLAKQVALDKYRKLCIVLDKFKSDIGDLNFNLDVINHCNCCWIVRKILNTSDK